MVYLWLSLKIILGRRDGDAHDRDCGHGRDGDDCGHAHGDARANARKLLYARDGGHHGHDGDRARDGDAHFVTILILPPLNELQNDTIIISKILPYIN